MFYIFICVNFFIHIFFHSLVVLPTLGFTNEANLTVKEGIPAVLNIEVTGPLTNEIIAM